jgi:hypothetical protein
MPRSRNSPEDLVCVDLCAPSQGMGYVLPIEQ